ncbi:MULTISPECIES: IS1096 element passenger TnpR family protein [unclassified Bradyrhizobium]
MNAPGGGAPGYAEYLDAIGGSAHPEHEQMRLWGSEQSDPNVFDRKAIEAAVNSLSENGSRGVASHGQNRRQAPIEGPQRHACILFALDTACWTAREVQHVPQRGGQTLRCVTEMADELLSWA